VAAASAAAAISVEAGGSWPPPRTIASRCRWRPPLGPRGRSDRHDEDWARRGCRRPAPTAHNLQSARRDPARTPPRHPPRRPVTTSPPAPPARTGDRGHPHPPCRVQRRWPPPPPSPVTSASVAHVATHSQQRAPRPVHSWWRPPQLGPAGQPEDAAASWKTASTLPLSARRATLAATRVHERRGVCGGVWRVTGPAGRSTRSAWEGAGDAVRPSAGGVDAAALAASPRRACVVSGGQPPRRDAGAHPPPPCHERRGAAASACATAPVATDRPTDGRRPRLSAASTPRVAARAKPYAPGRQEKEKHHQ